MMATIPNCFQSHLGTVYKTYLLMLQVKLIESFTAVLESAGVMYPDEDEEGDFVVKLAKLVCLVKYRVIIAQKLA